MLPGMQSAFVDIGLERDAFLYVSDFLELGNMGAQRLEIPDRGARGEGLPTDVEAEGQRRVHAARN